MKMECPHTQQQISLQQHGNGTRHLRCYCSICGKFIKWFKQGPELERFLKKADIPSDAFYSEDTVPCEEEIWA